MSQAAVAVSVSRETTRKGVTRWRRDGKIPLAQKKPASIQSHLRLIRHIVAKDPRQSITAILSELRMQVDIEAEYHGVRDVIIRNQIPWLGSNRR